MSTTETESKQAKGICTEISEKGDWTTFHIDTGGQWPVKLSTKLEALVAQGREAKNAEAVWTYKESEGGDNPHKPGTKFKNRWLTSVEVGGDVTIAYSQPVNAGGNASAHQAMQAGDKDRAITRMTCLKAAADLYSAGRMSKDDEGDPPLGVMKAAARFETWIYRDISDTPSEAGRPALSQHDADIPF